MPLPYSYLGRLQQTPGRGTGDAPDVVQRHLPGARELLRQHRRRARTVPEDLSGVPRAARPGARPGWPTGRARSPAGISPSGSAGRSATGSRSPARSGSRSRARRGSSTSSGIYDGDDGIDKTQFFFRYDYLDENRAEGEGLVGWYVVKIADPSQAVALSRTFDEMFANSSAETKTTTEKGFIEGFAKQIGDIGAIMIAISSVVLFMFGLVAASTMAQSVRERTSELAVLKTLGFTGRHDSGAGPRRIALHRTRRRRARARARLAVRPAG